MSGLTLVPIELKHFLFSLAAIEFKAYFKQKVKRVKITHWCFDYCMNKFQLVRAA